MIGRAERLACVHGRLGARFGARPRATDWARLQAVRDAASYVDAARRSPVASLMDGLVPGQPVHAVEAALRERWRDAVGTIAGWHAGKDRAAIGWMSLLADLPAITHLANGGAVLDWMAADKSLEPFVAAAAGDFDALASRAELDAFLPAFDGSDTVWSSWLAHWKTLWPTARHDRAALERLVTDVTKLATGGKDRDFTLPGPDALDRVFEAAYRKHTRGLAASVGWLGMTANDLRRLRGHVATRLALPSRQPQGAAA